MSTEFQYLPSVIIVVIVEYMLIIILLSYNNELCFKCNYQAREEGRIRVENEQIHSLSFKRNFKFENTYESCFPVSQSVLSLIRLLLMIYIALHQEFLILNSLRSGFTSRIGI